MATVRQRLSDFMVRLGDEPELLEEYMKDRDRVMEREGVTSADRDAILSGDLREIRARLRTEYSESIEAMVVMEERPEEEEPPTIMKPEEEPPTIMEPEEEPPAVTEPDEAPVVMEPDTIMDPERGREPQAD